MLGAKVIARAKINLFLKVGRRREDGFHEVSSVMQSLELSDELYFRITDGSAGRIVLRCSDKSIPEDEGNLVHKAIGEFAGITGAFSGGGIEAFINKRIPVSSGLAGGSADAAAAIVAMNHIYELELPFEKLLEIGSRVGSDVPFCLKGGTALVTGRGEKLKSLEPLPSFQVVLASTGEEVSTSEAYERFDSLGPDEGLVSEEEIDDNLSMLLESINNRKLERISGCLHNSLESATIARDQVESYKKVAMDAGARFALMTGSGPTVFAVVSGLEEATEVAWELGKMAPVTIITSFAANGAQIST